MADQAKSESPTSGLSGFAALKIVGRNPFPTWNSPSTTSMVTPLAVPS
jgi:hypothetical protein